MRALLRCIFLCPLLIAATLAAGSTVITFEDLTTSGWGEGGQTVVNNQYSSYGVLFNSPVAIDYSKGLPINNFAHSGTKAIEQCYAAEFCTAPISISFTAGQQHVKAWIGYSSALNQPATVIMEAFDGLGHFLTSNSYTLAARSSPTLIRYPLDVGRFAGDIRRVDIHFADPSFNTNSLAVDDVEFDTIGPPPPCPATVPPTVTVSQPAGGLSVRCNVFTFQDQITSGDPYARRTLTVTGPNGQTQSWTAPVTTGTYGPIAMYDFLYPGVNTIVDKVEDCKGVAQANPVSINYDPVPDGIGVQLLGIEPTQAVQKLPASVPLISNKRTIVRVYLTLQGPLTTLTDVKGTLSAFSPGTDSITPGPGIAPYSVQSTNTVILTNSTDIAAMRRNINASLNFEIPMSWTQAGKVHFELTGLTVSGCNVRIPCQYCDNRGAFDALTYHTFQVAPPVRVRVVSVPYQTSSTGTVHSPGQSDIDHLISWLRRAYPTAQVISSQATFQTRTGTPGSTFDAGDVNSDLKAARQLEVNGGSIDPRTHYYGMVADDEGFMRGMADGIPSWVASGPTGIPGFPFNPGDARSWDTDGTYGDWYGGHELGHTFGRFHAEYCGAQACADYILWTSCPDGYVAYPYAFGVLGSDLAAGNYGFDVGDPSLHIPQIVNRVDVWHDMMTYCDHQWISDFTYEGILDRLQAEDPQNTLRAKRVKIPDALMVSAKMNLTKETAQLKPFWRIPNLDATDRPTGSHYNIVLKNSANQVLATYPFNPSVDTETVATEDAMATMTEVVPWVDGTARISIMRDNVEMGFRVVTPNTPTVKVLSPNGGEVLTGTTATVTWQASDADNDPLTYALQYSKDAGQTWQVVGMGIDGTSQTINLDEIPGSARALFRVYATDGVNTGADASDAIFAVRTKPPKPHITSPGDGSTYTTADTIIFYGDASDVEDGPLAGTALQWSSDIQGALGTGASISTTLKPGKHTITLTAIDLSGTTGQASITVNVTALPPIADAGQGRFVLVGGPAMLDGSGSSGVPSLSFHWEIASAPAGSTATLTNADTATPDLTPDRAGPYVLQLTVTDGTGTKAIARVTLTATSAVAALRIAGGLQASSADDLNTMNPENTGTSAGQIDMNDVVRLLRFAFLNSSGGGVVTVSSSNQFGGIIFGRGYGVIIDDPRLNGAPYQRVIATHQYVGAYVHQLAVFYNTGIQKWVAITEDHSNLPFDEKVNYMFGPDIGAVTRATSGGPNDYSVYLDDPRINFAPNLPIVAMHNASAVRGDSLGVRYDGTSNKWVAYNERGTAMGDNEPYFWRLGSGVVTRSEAVGYRTTGVYLNDSRINGNPNAIVIAQHQGVNAYNTSAMGVVYDTSRSQWIAYNEEGTPFVDGERVDYAVAQP